MNRKSMADFAAAGLVIWLLLGKPMPGSMGGNPFSDGGFHVLIVEDDPTARAKMPESQLEVLTGPQWKKYVVEKGGDWRDYNKDVDLTNELPVYQKAMKQPHNPLPYGMIGKGSGGWSGPLPEKLDDWTNLLQKYGG